MKKVGETEKVEVYHDDKGNKVYVCKFCGKEMRNKGEVIRHFNPNNPDEYCKAYDSYKKAKEAQEMQKQEVSKAVSKKEEYAPPSPDEEMREEMLKVFEEKLKITPGTDKRKIEWAVNYFRSTKVLSEDPTELFRFLERTFPKMDEVAIDFIVKEVFKVRDEYTRKSGAYYYGQHERRPRPYVYTQPGFTMPNVQGGDSLTATMMQLLMQQQQMMQQQYLQLQERYFEMLSNPKAQKTEEEIRAEIQKDLELKQLRSQVESMQQQMAELIKAIREGNFGRISPEGWKDDYARAFTEVGTQITSALTQLRVEQTKTRRMIMQYILAQQAGVSKPQGKGETEKEVIEELPEELIEKGEGGEEK